MQNYNKPCCKNTLAGYCIFTTMVLLYFYTKEVMRNETIFTRTTSIY